MYYSVPMNNPALNNAIPENPTRNLVMVESDGGYFYPETPLMPVRVPRTDGSVSRGVLVRGDIKGNGLVYRVHFDMDPQHPENEKYKDLTFAELQSVNPELSLSFRHKKERGSNASVNGEGSVISALSNTIQSLAGSIIRRKENS